uniref:Uncharacterized protein n=1 Tax=Photinus pyralis TaxID=7054 RepID=A0A1Y1LDG8_PHOPY
MSLSSELHRDLTLLAECTNLILFETPYWQGRRILNKFIYLNNKLIFDTLNNNNCKFHYINTNYVVNSTKFTSHGLHLRKSGKFTLIKSLIEIINSIPLLSFTEVNSNLVYINCDNSTRVPTSVNEKSLQQEIFEANEVFASYKLDSIIGETKKDSTSSSQVTILT